MICLPASAKSGYLSYVYEPQWLTVCLLVTRVATRRMLMNHNDDLFAC